MGLGRFLTECSVISFLVDLILGLVEEKSYD
jgi:hypothetical protein